MSEVYRRHEGRPQTTIKHIVPVLVILCIGGIILAACVAQNTPAAQPVDASASVPAPEPVTEPEPELLSRFDEYVVQYEQENGMVLAAASEEEKNAFSPGCMRWSIPRTTPKRTKWKPAKQIRRFTRSHRTLFFLWTPGQAYPAILDRWFLSTCVLAKR